MEWEGLSCNRKKAATKTGGGVERGGALAYFTL